MDRGWFGGVMPPVKQEPEAFTAMIINSTSALFARKVWYFCCLKKVSGQLVKLAALNSLY